MKRTRREALVTIAAVAAASRLAGQSSALTAPEGDCLKTLVDTILPRTDTPGASDVGVPAYIEDKLTANADLRELFHLGIARIEADARSQFGSSFSTLTADQQARVLTPLVDDSFFRLVKGMTVDCYYASRDGLTHELGWHGNTFLTEFKGCTHPEHQS